jgi:hypothetical protein
MIARPGAERIAVALEALEADARAWTGAAGELRTAAARAAGQGLDPAAFSVAGAPVAAAYEALRTKTAGLLTAGADNFDAIARALRTSAAAYAAEEAARAGRMRGIS